jgi:hypothetical protein
MFLIIISILMQNFININIRVENITIFNIISYIFNLSSEF